jgi:hypothetical protein
VIRVFRICSSAVIGDLDPRVLHILEAELLRMCKVKIDQRQEISQYKRYVGSSSISISAKDNISGHAR